MIARQPTSDQAALALAVCGALALFFALPPKRS